MKSKKLFIVILIIGLLLRLFLLFYTNNISHDNVMYLKYGENLIQNGKYEFVVNYNWGVIYPPMYPITVGLLNLILDNLYISGRLISFFCSMITIFIFYLIGRKLYNEKIGLFAALGFAIFPLISFSSTEMTSEPIFHLLFFLSIYLFLLIFQNVTKKFYYFLFCLSVGMAILTRPEGMILILLLFIILIKHIKKCNVLINVILSIFFILLIIFPYIIFLHNETGTYKISGAGGANLYLGNIIIDRNYDKLFYSLNENKTQLYSLEFGNTVSTISYIIKNYKHFIYRYTINLSKTFIIYSIILLLPFFIMLFISLLDRNIFRNIYQLTFLLLSIFITLVYCLYFINPRFLTTPTLLLFLFSLNGLYRIDSIRHIFDYYKLNNKIIIFIKSNIKNIVVMFFIFCCLCSFVIETVSYNKIDYSVYQKVANYIKHDGLNKPNIMFRKPIINFYIDSVYTNLPYDNSTNIIKFAKLHNVDYIVISDAISKWSCYDSLIKLDEYSDEVELVYEHTMPLVNVFKVKQNEWNISIYTG